jgi:hypothetical protein
LKAAHGCGSVAVRSKLNGRNVEGRNSSRRMPVVLPAPAAQNSRALVR